MLQYKMSVSARTTAGKNKALGSVTISVPLLEDFGIAAEISATDDTGLPTYKDGKAALLFDALLAYVKAVNRNRLDGVAIKPGMTLPVSLDDYINAATATKGSGLTVYRETLDGIEQFLTKTKSAKYAAAVAAVLRQKTVLATLPADKRTKVLDALRAYAATLAESVLQQQYATLHVLEQACLSAQDAELDF